MDIRIVLFGKPEIRCDNVPIELRMKKAVGLVAYLATTGQTHTRERLATLFWPDSKEDVARTSLRQVTGALRETPLASMLITNRTTIQLHPDATSDVQEFLAQINQTATIRSNLTLETVAHLQKAESLYRGEFLEDFNLRGGAEWDDWQQFRRIEFQYQATQVIATLTRYYTQQGLAASGLKMAARWLEMDPSNDEAHYLTMHLYMQSQQIERALEQYHLFVRLLDREYGRTPDAEVQKLYQQIRQGDYQAQLRDEAEARQVRSLLPRPVIADSLTIQHCQTMKAALGLDLVTPAFLVVVHDKENTVAPDVIATLAHLPDVHQCFLDGVLWGRLDSSGDLEAILRLWLDAMRVSVLKSTSRLEHLAWQFHNGQRNKRLLFLLENVSDADQARLLMPGYAGCSLIVTTADRQVAQELAAVTPQIIELPSSSAQARLGD